MATAKKAAVAPQVSEPAEPLDASTPAKKAAAGKVAAKKAPVKKAARKTTTAKAQPPVEPSAVTRISPTAAWPFPTGTRP